MQFCSCYYRTKISMTNNRTQTDTTQSVLANTNLNRITHYFFFYMKISLNILCTLMEMKENRIFLDDAIFKQYYWYVLKIS